MPGDDKADRTTGGTVPPIDLPPHASGYWRRVLAGFVHGGGAVVLLVALTAFIHGTYWLPTGDAFLARWVAASMSPRNDDELRLPIVEMIEVDAAARARYMEKEREKVDDSTTPSASRAATTAAASHEERRGEFERTDGVRPIDRTKMAAFLARLAEVLEARRASSGQSPKVIGIDVDLAPLESEAKSPPGMFEALKKLRRIAPLVVIVADRPPDERRKRNKFMRDTECTPDEKATSDEFGLYFASPTLFSIANEAPFRFVMEVPAEKKIAGIPQVFPSLGNLVYLLLPKESSQAAHQNPASNGKPYQLIRSIKPEDLRDALTSLCRHARSSLAGTTGDALLQDAIADGETGEALVANIKRVYQQPMYNWRLLDQTTIKRVSIASKDFKALFLDRAAAEGPQLALSDSDALIISFAGVGNVDKYFVPYLPASEEQSPSGAMLHALTAASLAARIDEVSWEGLLIDLGIGLLFVLLIALCVPWIKSLGQRAQFSGRLALGCVPLIVASICLWVSIQISVFALDRDVWFNPFFVIIGLAAHAYLEPWSLMDGSEEHATSPKEMYSFGFARLAREFSSKAIEQGAAAPSRWDRFDALFEVLVRWLILIGGVGILLLHPFAPH